MKYIRLLQSKNQLFDDVLHNAKTYYPVVSLLKNNNVVKYIGNPVANVKINVDGENPEYLLNDFNIKKLTIDGQLVFNKELWVKHEDTVSMNDFGTGNYNLTTFNKPQLFTLINGDCTNVRITSNEKITKLLLIQGDLGGYGIEYVDIQIVENELAESLQLKKIDDYTFDITGLFKYDTPGDPLLILGANDDGLVLEQTISYECLEVNNSKQSMIINSDNAFDLHNHGTEVTITGDFNENDSLLILMAYNGELYDHNMIPIQTFIEYGAGNFNNNVLTLNLDVLIGQLPSSVAFSYVIIDGSFDEDNVNDINDVLPYIKTTTITFKPSIILPLLSEGEHELKIELISQERLPYLYIDLVKKLDLSKLVGMQTINENEYSDFRNLTSIIIPDSVTSIGKEAFRDCDNLINVNLGNGVTTIGEGAFAYCNSLTSITIPDSVTSIGEGAFGNSPFYDNLPDGDVYLGKCYYAYKGSMPSNTSIIITDGTKSIGSHAFSGCDNLTEIVIPNSVTSIGERAFYHCDSLTEIIIPDSVTSIGDSAFYYCDNLTSVTIPDSVISIGEDAFYDTPFYDNLPDGEVYLGKCYYMYKGSMPSNTSIVITDGTKSIGSHAFSGCDNLTEIIIPNSVTSIGVQAFYHCDSLSSITIPDSVTTIGEEAFAYCGSLTEINSYAIKAPSLGYRPFTSIADNGVLRVPSGSDYSRWLRELPSGWVVEYI